MNGLPGAESRWQVAPRQTGLRDEDDPVQEATVGQFRRSAWPAALRRQQSFETGPVGVGQLVSAHHNRRSRDDLPVDPSELSDRRASGISDHPNFRVAEFADTP